jgi:hypothetical protein
LSPARLLPIHPPRVGARGSVAGRQRSRCIGPSSGVLAEARDLMPGALHAYASALADLFYPQYCVGCERRASDLLCFTCFQALPLIGSPACARCGMPTAFETFVCDECKGEHFGFESARAHLGTPASERRSSMPSSTGATRGS